MSTKVMSLAACLALASTVLLQSAKAACPFCPTAATTLSEDLHAMDVVAVGQLVSTKKNDEGVQIGQFSITKVLKGKTVLGDTPTIAAVYFGESQKRGAFLLQGSGSPKLNWSVPIAVSDRGLEYVTQLMALPKSATNRLTFFQKYLESDDEFVTRDAFDEFSRASYREIIAHRPQMDHDQLVEWIKSRDIPASRRRLYLTMLGVCGTSEDLPVLEKMMKSPDRQDKAGLDAMIACYLTLHGEKGLPLIDDLFIKNKAADYADTYSAIMAIRFHASEADVVPRERLLVSLRYMLDRAPLADLVIPDLARWEDWTVIDKLVRLFKEADEKSNWVRVPVINYLRVCPLPEAEAMIKELEKIDPDSVQRARAIFPNAAADASET